MSRHIPFTYAEALKAAMPEGKANPEHLAMIADLKIQVESHKASGMYRDQMIASLEERVKSMKAEIADLSAIIKAEHQAANRAEASGRTKPVTTSEWRLSGESPMNFLAREFPYCTVAQAAEIEELRSTMETANAINTVLGIKEPEPESTERKPRALTDNQCSALSHLSSEGLRYIIAGYERMRPSLLEDAE